MNYLSEGTTIFYCSEFIISLFIVVLLINYAWNVCICVNHVAAVFIYILEKALSAYVLHLHTGTYVLSELNRSFDTLLQTIFI